VPAITLPDGRALAYEQWGDPAGVPVVFFHGAPGSRMFRLDDDAVATTGTRLITVDRPGFGRSDFLADRTIRDWPEDVAPLLDALDLDRIGFIGGSAGGAYALACAHAMPERVAALTLMCPIGPFVDVPAFDEGQQEHMGRLVVAGREASTPEALDKLLRVTVKAATQTADTYRADRDAWLDTGSSDADSRWQQDPTVRAMLFENFDEAFRQGPAGLAYESFLLFTRPWGFRTEDVHVPATAWVGDQDRMRRVSEFYASAMPSCELHLLEGEGHLIGPPHHEAIVRAATAWAH
jgi:pimeloyl-ACP methyl ester carboxylesterase